MKQSSRRLFSMLIALGFLVVALFIFFDLIQPTYAELQTKKGEQVSSENLLVEERRIVEQAKVLISKYEVGSQAQENLALAMPSGPNVAGALAQIYGIAENNGVTVRNFSIAPPSIQLQQGGQAQAGTGGGGTALALSQVAKPLGTLSLQFTAAGSYESFKGFLSQIETNIRIFDVREFALQPAIVVSPTGKQVATNLFSYNVTVVTYYQLP